MKPYNLEVNGQMKKGQETVRSESGLELIADLLKQRFSFDYDTIDNARQIVRAGIYSYEFDATTLLPYDCNLNNSEGERLDELIKPFYMKMKGEDREAYKELCERRTLHYFLLCAPEIYRNCTIKKSERPDFILTGERRVGIEITKLTTEYDEELFTLAKEINENGLRQEEEVKKHIERHHKHIKDRVALLDIAGKTNVSSGFHPLDSIRKHFAEEIKNKHDKYCDDIAQFDEFIILGDAASGSGLEISEKEDVQEVIDYLLHICPEIIDTTTVIAWREAEHQERIIYSWYYQAS